MSVIFRISEETVSSLNSKVSELQMIIDRRDRQLKELQAELDSKLEEVVFLKVFYA